MLLNSVVSIILLLEINFYAINLISAIMNDLHLILSFSDLSS